MVTLIILDGFGISKHKKGNAIKLAGTPFLDKLRKKYPNILLSASGESVGLPAGQMGNSEAGHLTIGAGRRFMQPLERINNAVLDGSFFENAELLRAINFAKKSNGTLHIIGLLSDGGVHSHINHIKATIEMAHKNGIEKIALHAILDGRDTEITSGLDFIKEIEKTCKKNNCQLKTICGRVWAMDRERHYERIEKAYNCIVLGKADKYSTNPEQAIQESYNKKITDEFFEPVVVGEPTPILNGDSIIFCNLRKDRTRQLVSAISSAEFDKFSVKKFENICVVGFVMYDDTFKNVGVAFDPDTLKNGLAEVLSNSGKHQFHISETTKFAHVTHYFNGGRQEPFPLEDRKLLDTIPDLDFSQHPKMRAFDITSETLEAIASEKYDFILVNLSNCDMVGHTANMEATKTAVQVVDKCAYALAMATLMANGDCIITADHGNAEELLEKDGSPKTSHTTNPVPFILVSNKTHKLLKSGELANIAPTVLDLIGLEKPKEMANSLLKV